MAETSSGRKSSGNPPLWDGAVGKWPKWSRQFLAFCQVKQCRDALKPGGESNLPSREDADVSSEKGQREALDRNALAVAYLSLALDDDKLTPYLSKGETGEYPGGLAHLVWSALLKKMEPKDGLSQIEAIRALFSIGKGNLDDDPSILIRRGPW
mmetsp:Transcript_14285/g.23840  ORF Transcript_14285/g.23840 Transcript_14285/m.23840 type:complete len:154 (-) Transcript_14285:372-833(-)|eukprot:CAMPEP_0197734602 /NCGR_PEP_ID=MMETSP1434-20131217/44504_1 /TAXON_ID=265543 /ORGANISM="Minutocellus polymorphus, Strain CCMP3303" /LENGTH=153 /DNA_ID=CAMNT_0043322017 /DNA_START=93 /DNA_END=554 /DNA_ORIENTATION=+